MKVKDLIERLNLFYAPDDEIVVTWCDQDEMFDRMIDIVGEGISDDVINVLWRVMVLKAEEDMTMRTMSYDQEIEVITGEAVDVVAEGFLAKFEGWDRDGGLFAIINGEPGLRQALEAAMEEMGDE